MNDAPGPCKTRGSESVVHATQELRETELSGKGEYADRTRALNSGADLKDKIERILTT